MPIETAMPRSQQPRFLFPAWFWTVILFCLFAILVALFFGTTRQGDSYEERRAVARDEKLKTYRDESAKGLGSYGWTDKTKGVARIPIDRAMTLTLADLRAKKLAPANAIVLPTAPAGSAPQSGAAAPAATPGTAPAPTTAASGAKPAAITGPDSASKGAPASAVKPASVAPGTQPGAAATPAASPSAPSARAPVTPTGTPVQSSAGTPLPVPGR